MTDGSILLSHPEALAVRYAEDLAAMRAEIYVTLAQDAPEQLHPERIQLGAAVGADRIDVLSGFQVYHCKSPFVPVVRFVPV